jgi:hypothetical protein
MAKRKGRGRKPSSPDEIAEKRARAVAAERTKLRAEGIDVSVAEIDGVEITAARQAELEGKGAVVEVDHRRRLKSALAAGHHKADIWWRLHSRDALSKQQLNAVRDLQDLMAVRAGIGGRDERMAYERDKVEEPLRDPCLVTDAMLRAGREVDLWLALVGPPCSRLLAAMLDPNTPDAASDWRAVVERVTGASHVSSQSELLRFAAQALVDVRPQVERALKAAGQGKRERRDPQGFAETSAPVRTHPFHAGVGR